MAGNSHWDPEPLNNNGTRNVHVNPYFNKPTVGCQTMPCNMMYVNPKFPHLLPNKSLNKTKIYINPNFIRAQNTDRSHPMRIDDGNERSDQMTVQTMTPAPSSTSRYSLIRHQGCSNIHPDQKTLKPEKVSNTVKLGKYKSVPVNYIKKTLVADKCLSNCIKGIEMGRSNTIALRPKTSAEPNIFESRFKLVKHITNTTNKPLMAKRLFSRKQKFTHQQVRIKIAKGKFKKNNIPCPQFRKFGKCLRSTKGKCEFLHDRKHVAICRKFIKGLCHDPGCLLSHELTAKKMATCRFYLNGICTKENCPYLHVKLNDKSEICRDFLNGYCEKGTDCLSRHVNVNINERRTSASIRSNTAFRRKTPKSDGEAKTAVHNQAAIPVAQGTNKTSERNNSTEAVDCRYYQEPVNVNSNSDNNCAVIKPTRCKLGPLPSYIQF